MAAALDAEDICAICRNEQKVDPVVLECGHSYCSNCLVEFLDHCLPIADNPGTTGNPNQPIVSAPEQTSINQPNDSDIGIGFSCPQCRRPIVLDFLQNHTSSIHIRYAKHNVRYHGLLKILVEKTLELFPFPPRISKCVFK